MRLMLLLLTQLASRFDRQTAAHIATGNSGAPVRKPV